MRSSFCPLKKFVVYWFSLHDATILEVSRSIVRRRVQRTAFSVPPDRLPCPKMFNFAPALEFQDFPCKSGREDCCEVGGGCIACHGSGGTSGTRIDVGGGDGGANGGYGDGGSTTTMMG
ncbi:Uncharacterized protein Adt_41530 [Abeliophyllum distichum]|uniref:Uncharacterized protein n=1 Tax=Abeliophyllum distichum TaxID=126358 RepID=A0ABD1PP40_9LAMI